MTARVVRLQPKRQAEKATLMPAELSLADIRRLFKGAGKDGRTFEECSYAIATVRLWAETNTKPRARWGAVVLGALRAGWGVRGFKAWWDRAPGGHRGAHSAPYPGVKVTEEHAARVLAQLEREGRR